MTDAHGTHRFRPSALVGSWQPFWFRPEPTYTLGLIRIAFGVLTVAWGLSLLPDLYELFGTSGIAPQPPESPYAWGLFEFWSGDRAIVVGCIALVVAGVAMTIGWRSRLAAFVVFVLISSFQHRNPAVFNSGDALIRIEALIIAFSPCGAALSLDQRRRAGSFWSAQSRARWPLRLMQVQLSLIYLSTVQVKMSGDTWPGGTAVSYALQLDDMLIVRMPHWFIASPLLINVATWGTLMIELMLGILVWNRRLRPWVLAAGVIMHATIMLTINVGFFTLAMFVLYLAFISSETVRRLPTNIGLLADRIVVLKPRRKPVEQVASATDPAERRSTPAVLG